LAREAAGTPLVPLYATLIARVIIGPVNVFWQAGWGVTATRAATSSEVTRQHPSYGDHG
jgi:hypothetical protein